MPICGCDEGHMDYPLTSVARFPIIDSNTGQPVKQKGVIVATSNGNDRVRELVAQGLTFPQALAQMVRECQQAGMATPRPTKKNKNK